jgi:CheY-like chemotaxis protein
VNPHTTVVIVEDNADSREMLRTLLELEGYDAHGAADGAEGLDAIVSLQPDIALVDVGLPGLDGYEVARRARKDAPRTRLIALTGYGQPDDLRHSTAAGFDAHVVKPIDPGALLRLLADSPRRSS